ncbi:unnamed protein product [Acanthoscelides obtectus]|uniref:Uncharacterized protein n=1 Tax=Acanthoscelides obtectus TaxID=200917 RepID=A0A9P0PB15_ACAOB|nr:unnamed protein product [Acanthoscelides obtectus]CAK1664803.1 hypothetical protein AOBTE_LOCUS24475 [Acanthoscelides obtectus]
MFEWKILNQIRFTCAKINQHTPRRYVNFDVHFELLSKSLSPFFEARICLHEIVNQYCNIPDESLYFNSLKFARK